MRPVLFLIAALLLIAADQASKWFVMEHVVLEDGTFVQVLPFFNFVRVWNKGISFGMFNQQTDYGPYILIGVALVIAVLFTVWLFRTQDRVQSAGIILIISGAIGNIIDRVRFKAVFDFLDFHAFGHHWPAFNVADSCVVVGVIVMIFHSFFLEKKPGMPAGHLAPNGK